MVSMQPKRVMLWLGVLLVKPMLFDAVLSKSEGARPGTSLAGQLLVATPEMSDQRFRHTRHPDGAA